MTQTGWQKKQAKRLRNFCLIVAAFVAASACSTKHNPVQIHFASTWNERAINCMDGATALSDLRFFVSNLTLRDSSGTEHRLQLTKDEQWQQADIALIDLENGKGNCVNGSAEMNATVHGFSDAEDVVGIQFTLGVPFDRNHANPLTASPPLDRSPMHWHWRSGYKFLRVGVSTPSDEFWMHLGSTGCEGSVQNISRCSSTNRVTVILADFDPLSDIVAVDLAALLKQISLSDGDPSDCSSSVAEEACQGPFAALGLAFGEIDGGKQSVFRNQN